jgi:hypothetical protein
MELDSSRLRVSIRESSLSPFLFKKRKGNAGRVSIEEKGGTPQETLCKGKNPSRGKNSTPSNDNFAAFFEEVLSQNGWHKFGFGIRWLARRAITKGNAMPRTERVEAATRQCPSSDRRASV